MEGIVGGGKILCMNILTGILAPFFFFATPAGKPVMVPDMFIWYARKSPAKNVSGNTIKLAAGHIVD